MGVPASKGVRAGPRGRTLRPLRVREGKAARDLNQKKLEALRARPWKRGGAGKLFEKQLKKRGAEKRRGWLRWGEGPNGVEVRKSVGPDR